MLQTLRAKDSSSYLPRKSGAREDAQESSMAAFGGAPASDAPEPASDPPVPSLQRAVSAHTHSVLGELADECICPCSHGLMVDPVIASDGVSYDRASIEQLLDTDGPSKVSEVK